MQAYKVKKHVDRPDLTGEHPFGDLGQLILLLLFIGLWVLDTFFFKFPESEYFKVPMWLHIALGGFILISGFYFARRSMKMIFGVKSENPQVINHKVYEKVRHPMYLGALLFYLGVTILMYSLPLLIMFILIFFFYNFIAKHEEKLLLKQFGDDYVKYMKKARRWIPKF